MNKLKKSLTTPIDTDKLKQQVEQITDKSKLENKSEKSIRLSVSIFESKHKALKIRCIDNNTNIQEIVSTLIDKYLNNDVKI